jgi:demethylmenaquinone methyltransferase/2-methoxy-6-polyprenyl-1,4-benzoquinol methylase
LISGNRDAYNYLAYSANHFYTLPELSALLKNAGFSTATGTPLMMGAAAIMVAVK